MQQRRLGSGAVVRIAGPGPRSFDKKSHGIPAGPPAPVDDLLNDTGQIRALLYVAVRIPCRNTVPRNRGRGGIGCLSAGDMPVGIAELTGIVHVLAGERKAGGHRIGVVTITVHGKQDVGIGDGRPLRYGDVLEPKTHNLPPGGIIVFIDHFQIRTACADTAAADPFFGIVIAVRHPDLDRPGKSGPPLNRCHEKQTHQGDRKNDIFDWITHLFSPLGKNCPHNEQRMPIRKSILNFQCLIFNEPKTRIQYPASSIRHPASSIQYPASSIQPNTPP